MPSNDNVQPSQQDHSYYLANPLAMITSLNLELNTAKLIIKNVKKIRQRDHVYTNAVRLFSSFGGIVTITTLSVYNTAVYNYFFELFEGILAGTAPSPTFVYIAAAWLGGAVGQGVSRFLLEPVGILSSLCLQKVTKCFKKNPRETSEIRTPQQPLTSMEEAPAPSSYTPGFADQSIRRKQPSSHDEPATTIRKRTNRINRLSHSSP